MSFNEAHSFKNRCNARGVSVGWREANGAINFTVCVNASGEVAVVTRFNFVFINQSGQPC